MCEPHWTEQLQVTSFLQNPNWVVLPKVWCPLHIIVLFLPFCLNVISKYTKCFKIIFKINIVKCSWKAEGHLVITTFLKIHQESSLFIHIFIYFYVIVFTFTLLYCFYIYLNGPLLGLPLLRALYLKRIWDGFFKKNSFKN
jgi:hypothetical protein